MSTFNFTMRAMFAELNQKIIVPKFLTAKTLTFGN